LENSSFAQVIIHTLR